MAPGRRCDNGCASWPLDDRYVRCPVCLEPTEAFRNLDPLDPDEALHLEFEAFYMRYCERRSQPAEGPLPMSPEESLYWQGKYPNAAPSPTPS